MGIISTFARLQQLREDGRLQKMRRGGRKGRACLREEGVDEKAIRF